jgi:hypothetical protein
MGEQRRNHTRRNTPRPYAREEHQIMTDISDNYVYGIPNQRQLAWLGEWWTRTSSTLFYTFFILLDTFLLFTSTSDATQTFSTISLSFYTLCILAISRGRLLCEACCICTRYQLLIPFLRPFLRVLNPYSFFLGCRHDPDHASTLQILRQDWLLCKINHVLGAVISVTDLSTTAMLLFMFFFGIDSQCLLNH